MSKPEIWISGISAAVAIASFGLSFLTRRDLEHHQSTMRGWEAFKADLQERMVALEEAREVRFASEAQRAHLRAAYSRPHLRIWNDGPESASNIRVLVDGTLWAEHDWTRGEAPEVLGAGGTWTGRFIAAATVGNPRAITLLFTDAQGEQKWESSVGSL